MPAAMYGTERKVSVRAVARIIGAIVTRGKSIMISRYLSPRAILPFGILTISSSCAVIVMQVKLKKKLDGEH